ncbi:Gfo/Idh/MocA family protein [Lysobacter korlensis]|uniref:Gfo/Idh/MocA family protein n=1 Tax=Lysobacter korlensis TaxID=553636 RepID=A0ABV6RYD4_9GAMM
MATGLRWGILGAGGIAGAFVKDLQANGRTVTAVGSRSDGTAREFAGRYGIANAHGSYADLVADDAVDAVYVATPHPFHASNAELALNAGKHVLVEKPFTLNAAEARSVVDLAAARGLVVLEAMWTRWVPTMVRLREVIASGAIGDVRTLIADHTQLVKRDLTSRMYDPALGGGALLDLGVYPLSFASDILGTPNSIQAFSTPTETGVDAQTSIVLGYEDGRSALIHTALDAKGPNTAAILGTQGRIAIDPVWYTPTSFTVFDARDEVLERYEVPQVTGRGMQFQAFELERLAAAGALSGDILSTEESVSILETMDEIRRQIGVRYPNE